MNLHTKTVCSEFGANHLKKNKLSRRRILSRLVAVLGGVVTLGRVNAATSTPKASEGPFYPELSMRFGDVDNDLVKIDGMVNVVA